MKDVLILLAGALIAFAALLPYVNKHRAEIAQGWRDVLGLGDRPKAHSDRPVERRAGWWLPFGALAAIGGITLAVGAIFGRWLLLVLGITTLVFAGGGLLVAWRS